MRDRSVTPHAFKQGDIGDMARVQFAAEIDAAQGEYESVISKRETALSSENSLGYDDNEFFPIFIRHVLGAIPLEDGRYEEAERIYRPYPLGDDNIIRRTAFRA